MPAPGTNRKGRVLIFCGVPGSGKTTIARLVAQALGSAVHIQADTFRFMIPRPAYTFVEGRFVYESMFLVGRQALKSGYDAILDATFLKEDYRQEAENNLARYCSSSTVVCVTCDLEVAKARNLAREPVVPEASFERLAGAFEEPDEGIFVRSDKRTPESAADYIVHKVGKRFTG